MNAKLTFRRFLRDEAGISSVEFALVSFVFLLMVLAIVDFSRAMWEWNRAAKATQAGVRHAVVRDIVATNFRTFDGTTATDIGTSVPEGAGPPVTTCTSAGCDDGSGNQALDALGQAAWDEIVAWMVAYDGAITEDNVVITYRHVGFGMAGCPGCPDVDPLVTVSLRNMNFDLFTPGLAQLASPIAMPDFASTLSGEDGHSPPAP